MNETNTTQNKEIDISQLRQKEIVREKKEQKNKISEEFIREHLPVVESVASGIASGSKMPPGISYQDLVSWGVEGLIKAKNNFKEDKGTKFKTYAFYRIRGEMLDKLRREWSYRNPADYKQQQEKIQMRIAEVTQDILDDSSPSLDTDTNLPKDERINDIISNSAVVYLLSLDEIESVSVSQGTGDPSIEVLDEMDRTSTNSILWEEINSLEADEKKVVELFYVKDLKQKEIAEALNLSRSKVCRLHMKVLEKLKRRLQRRMEI
jgi:RNA polymerase sigma factor for flagellar operon FliA